ncbi:F-box protein At3g07870 [Punica granatum]|uniref:F-box domain-containing protein n=2 Tax=Punica granatum TaxID=22663 RepID=A0A218WS17_PUNGR|nr:F-box protein At3g07870 [Punica granatum]OWM75433.1 hypothetical protein CDL15_Pgr021597 [Punica granatum]PKI35526.1 hypothetical protein CRG98_043980 [Punica granatum]
MDLGPEPPMKRPRSSDPDEGRPVSGMERLPREIILDILSRLPVTSIIRFRLVSRAWRELARDPLLPEAQLARTARFEPFLIFHCDSPIRNDLYFAKLLAHDRSAKVLTRKFHPPFWHNMAEFEVVGSCNGILCLADSLYKESIYLYNPFTGDHRLLPRPKQYPNQEAAFGFGVDQKTGEYKVVKVVYYTKSTSAPTRTRRIAYQLSDLQVLTVGRDRDWRSLGKVPYQIARRPSEALLCGRLHWVTRPRRYRRLVSFDLSEERFEEVPVPGAGPLNWCNYQLMVLGGSLSAIVYCYHGRIEIWVMKVYGEKDSWAKEFNIGAHVPKGLRQQSLNLPSKICRSLTGRVRALCMLEDSGEILLEYKGRALVAYDPKKGKFRDVLYKGTPPWFQAFVHLGTLNWVDGQPLH